jgi:hypothetical protein
MGNQDQQPVAKFAPGFFGAIRVYRDGTIKSRFGNGSVIGAVARVDQSGSERLFQDTRQTYLTIEGPNVTISVKLASNGGLSVSAARKFAATVNQLSHLRHPEAQRPEPRRPGTKTTSEGYPVTDVSLIKPRG